jgi:formylmethanofuran dehydrogenase subunit E
MIVPLPKVDEAQVRRTQGKKSEILSSTPYKDQLEESLAEKTQQVKRRVFSGKLTKEPTKRKKKQDKDAVCPSCGESYSSTTKISDWLQCIKCKQWWHEECTDDLDETEFICDRCTN